MVYHVCGALCLYLQGILELTSHKSVGARGQCLSLGAPLTNDLCDEHNTLVYTHMHMNCVKWHKMQLALVRLAKDYLDDYDWYQCVLFV